MYGNNNGMNGYNQQRNGYNNGMNNQQNKYGQPMGNLNRNSSNPNNAPPPPPSGPPPQNKAKKRKKHGNSSKKKSSNGHHGHNQHQPQNSHQQQNSYNPYQQPYHQNANYAQSFAQLPHQQSNGHNTHNSHTNNHHKSSTLQQPTPANYFGSYSTNNLIQLQNNNNVNPQQFQQNAMRALQMQQSMTNINRSNINNNGPPKKTLSPQGSINSPMSNGQQNGYNNHNNVNNNVNTQWNYQQQQQQQQQPQNNVQNGYHNMTNPAAAFQAMQQGSQYGSFIGMQQQQMGSNRNLNMGQNVYKQQLQNNPSGGGYGLQQPTSDFIHKYGPAGPFAQPQYGGNTYFAGPYNDNGQNAYYPQQPSGGGDLVPPPPMIKDEKGEMIPSTKKKKKRRKHRDRGDRDNKKRKKSKHRDRDRDRDRDGRKKSRHRSRDKDGKKKKRSSSRTRDKQRSKKSSNKKEDSPPPPPPPSSSSNNNNNKLDLPNTNTSSKSNIKTNSDEDSGSSSEGDSSEGGSDDDKSNIENVPDPGYKDASTVFNEKVNASKKKKKGRHGRFESKNQFIRRRPVSGVPMSVQKQLHGIKDDKLSSHLKLIHSKRTEKTNDTIKFLKECLLKEVLFQGMDDKMINEIVDVMYRVDCPFGECIIRQNEYGDAYFVIQSGAFDIIHQEMDGGQQKIVGEMLPGKAFGEGSLLYSIPRAATLKATKPCIVWALDATKFLEIRQKISQQVNDKTSKVVRYLKKIELFKKYHHQDLVAIGQAVTERKYPKNAHIIQQGDEASEFFIVKTGACIAVIKTDDSKEQTVKKYSDGEFFGERGIYKNEKRAASIIATSTTRCYVIKAIDFTKLLANPLSKHFEEQIKAYDDIAFDNGIKRPFQNLIDCKLSDFVTLGILGVGSFGRVSLVKDPKSSITYSLKKVRKNKVIETGQQEHVRNERAVLATLDSDFCVKLFGTYSDELNIYFLMEPVLGGELFTVLRWNKRFSEKTARFYAACVVLAFEHLHGKNIIYRDLKPENLLISKNGYCKLVDFGFAKKRNNSCTLCGTPEYLSPEVIQNYSQGFAVDWWALGIFIYEMVVGHAPFQDDPNVKMYEKILTYDTEFPPEPKLTPRVEHLICGLLEKNSFQRVGAGTKGTLQILNHPWFHGLNWDEMRAQKIAPPYVPNIADQEDLSHYDAYPDENIVEKLDPDPSAYEWCEDF